MDLFLSVVCVFCVATAAAANGGYNYQQPRPIINQAFRPSAPFVNSATSSVVQYTPLPNGPSIQYAQQQFAAPVQVYAQPAPQFVNAPSQYFVPPQPSAPYAPAAAPQYNQQRQTIVSKTIYIHSSPEETEEINTDQAVEAEPIRKNYRIVFIKAPSQNIRINMNSIKQAQAANEEKTIIYVLSKKPDISNFQNQLAAVQNEQKVSKPEVYFIKYKTQAEANRAQQEIQAQYDALGGSTNISDEGIAPVTSVIGSIPLNAASSNQQNFAQKSFGANQGSASSVSLNVISPKYLPAKSK